MPRTWSRATQRHRDQRADTVATRDAPYLLITCGIVQNEDLARSGHEAGDNRLLPER